MLALLPERRDRHETGNDADRRDGRARVPDFAQARLRVLLRHLRPPDQVEPAVADVDHLPFRPATFARIVSTQVLEHVPTRELRRTFVCRLYDLLSAGGSLVVTVSNHARTRRRTGTPREGRHRSGIFHHCGDRDQRRDDLPPFRIAELCGIRHRFSGSYALEFVARLGALGARIDHAFEASRLSLAYGSLLPVHGVKARARRQRLGKCWHSRRAIEHRMERERHVRNCRVLRDADRDGAAADVAR
jgi:hypothetical protein